MIGIRGYAESGKDEAGKILQELIWAEAGVWVEIGKFSYPIKKMIAEGLNLDLEEIESRKFKNTQLDKYWDTQEVDGKVISFFDTMGAWSEGKEVRHMTGRQFMIYIGMNLRKVCPDIYVNFYRVNHSGLSISTDTRFNNEVNLAKSLKGFTVQINRNVIVSKDESENSLTIPPDFIVDNTGTLAQLKTNLKPIADAFIDRFHLLS